MSVTRNADGGVRLDPEKDWELRVRCPDCGPVWAEVVTTERGEPVELACPSCPPGENLLEVRGSVRPDQLRELIRKELTHYNGGDDDGE